MSSMQDMLMRSQGGAGPEAQALITAYEAEQLIQQLGVTPIEQVGDARFLKQHDAIQKLNLQAHWNAQNHSDEFVLDLLVSLDKLSVLVQELLVVEAWKEQLLPRLREHLAQHVDSSIAYLVMFHEAAVANLLEVVLYHRHACEAVDDDSLLELADWAVRKLAYLNTDAHKHAAAKERSLQETLALTPLQELQEKQAEVDFGAATCGLTIMRYLTDHLPQLPLSVMSRLLRAHDAIMALLPLVDAPPWARTRPDGKLEKFIDGRWQQVAAADWLKVTQLDGQVWLSLVNLLVEPACRSKYNLDDYRRGCILRLQRHLNELLMDQLPVLRQLGRLLDELSLGIDGAAARAGPAGGGAPAAACLVIEQVPVLREALTRGKDWAAIAQQQRRQQFGPASRQLARERLQSILASFELLCQVEEQQQQQHGKAAPAAAAASSSGAGNASALEAGGADEAAVHAATVRVVCSRQLHASGLWEHWCEFTAGVDASKPSDPVTISTSGAGTSSSTSSGGGGSSKGAAIASSSSSSSASEGSVIRGRRYRLATIDPNGVRALPSKGKVAVHFMGGVAEALLQLPEVPFGRADAAVAAGVPGSLWLTAGLLAADGFALQLRLVRADKPKERDRVEGGWFAYHPVGGAITVRAQEPPPAAAAGAAAAARRRRGPGIMVLPAAASGGAQGRPQQRQLAAKPGEGAARAACLGGRPAADVAPVKP